ncbi:hypothetical protein [Ferrovum sp.]|uniref:hypothetical protein n=1 Tax=Ferrovum sp. TaxID=2609467 RepID=UPI002608C555|nr:hypothetical protein [Ferrovum sp.]
MNYPLRFQLDPQLQNQIWNGDLQLPQKQIDLRLRLKKWMSNREKCPYSRFLSGKEITEMPARDDMTRLTADLMARFQPMVQAVNVMHLLGKLVDFNNAQSSIKLCPPPIPMIAKGETNPFAKADLTHLEDVSNFRTLLANALRDTTKTSERKPCEEGSPNNDLPQHKIQVGRLLLSAIVHGGLIHSSILESLIRMLSSDAPVLHSASGRVYVEFSLSYKNQENSEFRRWFPDALTSVLLIRIQRETVRQVIPSDVLQEDKKSNLREHLWRCIKAFLRDAGVSSGQLPRSLAQLLALAKLDLEARIPIFLVNYAARKFVSHSLKPDVWRRLHGLTPENIAETRSEQTSDTSDRFELPDVGEQEEIESRWLQVLRHSLKGNDRAVVINQIMDLLAANHEAFAPGYPGELFAGFSLYILHAKNGQSYRFALASMRDYVIGVSRRLGGLLGMESVREFDSMSWSNLYEEVLSDAESIGLRRKVIRILREFQRYLEAERGMPALEEDVLGTTVGLVPVDANIISEYEFLKARQKFWSNSKMEKDLATSKYPPAKPGALSL